MGLDIRFPIGIILTIYGLVLAIYGVVADPASPVSDPAIAENVVRLNIDMWWGVAMLVFGLFMSALAFRASRR
ncbi:MAG TPA: hypothetical protein VMG63_07790 [Terriglobia bacterium]|jgi:hypothetical protein|nr:hypothetical protein [Terriglobia bacterium]